MSYPRFTMAGIMTAPMAAVSAGPVPEMAPKRTQPHTATIPSPPGIGPDEQMQEIDQTPGEPHPVHEESGQNKERNRQKGEFGNVGKKIGGKTWIPRL